MHYVYILYSKQINRYYIGETSDVEGRLGQHQSGFYKGAFTKQTNDWELYLTIELVTRIEALKIERYIKQRKSRKYIEILKRYPSRVEELKAKLT